MFPVQFSIIQQPIENPAPKTEAGLLKLPVQFSICPGAKFKTPVYFFLSQAVFLLNTAHLKERRVSHCSTLFFRGNPPSFSMR
jgi:hypothetical protein